MNWLYAQISLSGYFEGDHALIKQKVEEAMSMACRYLEEELKHESIGYNFTQFKTEQE